MNNEHRSLKYSLVLPAFMLVIMWLVKLFEYSFDISLAEYGIYPGTLKGMRGIIFSPFIHGDFSHLMSNSVPFLFLSTSLFYFYRKKSYQIFFILYIFIGFWVWVIARNSYHIGASGLIYGIAFFIMISGLIHGKKSLIAVSFVVIFLYGSMIWGVLPVDDNISWESHLVGAVSGILAAVWYAKESPFFSETKIEKTYYEEYSDINISSDSIKNVKYHYTDDSAD